MSVPIVVFIIGCFLGGLYWTGHGSRRLPWVVSGTCALLCVTYLVADQAPLSGFSLSSLSIGATHETDPPVPPWTETPRSPPAGESRVSLFDTAAISAAFAKVRTLGDSRVAARLGFTLYLLGAVAILLQPRSGVSLILFFALAGDARLLPWYPFAKGFSARESLFFLHDGLIISPLELYIALTAFGWWVRRKQQGDRGLYTGKLFWPALAFAAFLVFGLGYGVATGGDARIALWEARGVFYLVPLLLLASNLVEEPVHVTRLLSAALAAVFIKGVLASLYYLVDLESDLNGMYSIAEHGAAIHLNTLLVASGAVWLYRSSLLKRTLLPLSIPFVGLGYIAMQRRAAFVTLAIAVALVIAVLFKEQRRLFWRVAPAVLLLGACYLAVCWNSQGTLAVPAQAIKSVYAVQLASARDQRSNNYRVLEDRNINYTIHQHPFAGIGFGHKFSMVVAMPDISRFFEWWEYITHNSIMWIWMKAGLGGFFSLLCLIGLAVTGGARALDRLRRDDLGAVVLTATLYIVMHFIYACVDMSWDAQSAVYVGAMMGVVNRAEWSGTRRQ